MLDEMGQGLLFKGDSCSTHHAHHHVIARQFEVHADVFKQGRSTDVSFFSFQAFHLFHQKQGQEKAFQDSHSSAAFECCFQVIYGD